MVRDRDKRLRSKDQELRSRTKRTELGMEIQNERSRDGSDSEIEQNQNDQTSHSRSRIRVRGRRLSDRDHEARSRVRRPESRSEIRNERSRAEPSIESDQYREDQELGSRLRIEVGGRGSNNKKEMTQSEAIEAVKQMEWPDRGNFYTDESWRSVYKRQIDAAVKRRIPDDIIVSAVSQSLIKTKKTAEIYSKMEEVYNGSTLSGIIKIIENFDCELSCEDKQGQLNEIAMEDGETARSYLGKLRRAHKQLFPKEDSKERVRKAFLEGFKWEGKSLDRRSKQFLMCTPDMLDLPKRTMERIKENGNLDEMETKCQPLPPIKSYAQQNGYQRERAEDVHVDPQSLSRQMGPTMAQQEQSSRTRSLAHVGQGSGSGEAGIHRASHEAVIRGQTASGAKVCYRCASTSHIAKNCKNNRYCAYCGIETIHLTRKCSKRFL